MDASSQKEKIVTYKYSGNLSLYYETGYEGTYAVILEDDRGISPGPSWNNETQKYDGPPMNYKSLEWAYFFSKRSKANLKVFDVTGEVIYEGPVSWSKDKILLDRRVNFIPEEIPTRTWLKWCSRELKAEVLTDTPVIAEEKK